MIEKVGLFYDPRKPKPWIVRWFGVSTEDGMRRRYSRSFVLKRDAETFRSNMQVEFNNGGQRDKRVITVKQLCDQYLEIMRHKLRPSSLIGYDNTIPQLKKFFGDDLPIERITREKAEKFIATREIVNEIHKRKNKLLSSWSRNQHLKLARAIFGKAVEWEYIKRNPFSKIEQIKADRKPWHFITPEEFAALLAVVPDYRTRVMYAVMYGAGLRYGEALNLLWNGHDIDFERSRINVSNRAAMSDLPGFSVKDHDCRSIPMPKWLADMIAQLQLRSSEGCPFVFLPPERWAHIRKTWQNLFKTHATDQWFNSDLLNNVLRKFKMYCRNAGIKPTGKLTIHCLRKSYAQNLADAGTPAPTLKKLMGHASIRTTEEFYLRSSDANEQRACEVLDQIVRKKLSDAGMTPDRQKQPKRGKKKASEHSQVSEATGFTSVGATGDTIDPPTVSSLRIPFSWSSNGIAEKK